MKTALWVCFLVLAGLSAKAASEGAAESRNWFVDLFFLNPEIRYERNANQDIIGRNPMGLGIGGCYKDLSVILELTNFAESTGNDTLSIDRQHRDALIWAQQDFWRYEILSLYAEAGVGASDETVTTTFNGSVDTAHSGLGLSGGLGGGAQVLFLNHFIVRLEGRLLAGKNFDPNPQGSILLRLGAEF